MNTEKKKFNLLVCGLLIGIIIASMDSTIVSTAMGSIISDFGKMSLMAWISSAYLITSVAVTPIYGRLSDMYGRKRFFLFGIALFCIGSLLCGNAASMEQLILFRAIQGIGGGAIMPIAFSIIFDIVPPENRGKFSGLFGAAFGISSIFGPLVGSLLSDHASWRYAFLLNVPLGILAVLFVIIGYRESQNHSRMKIDWLGSFFLIAGVTSLMFSLDLGGNQFPWNSWQIISLLLSFGVCFILFLFTEFHAEVPIIPLHLFRGKLFACSQLIGLLFGSVFIISIIYIPIFIQGVNGNTATHSGLVLMPMMLASVLGSQIGGSLIRRFSYRLLMLLSAFTFLIGLYSLSTLTMHSSNLMMILYMIITGIGVGISFSVLMMSSTDQISPKDTGAATSSVTFFRSLGMTFGITIFGAIQSHLMNASFSKELPGMLEYGQKLEARTLLQPQVRALIPASTLTQMTKLLAGSITHTFLYTMIPLTLSLVFIIIMGNHKLQIREGAMHVDESSSTRNFNGREQSSI